jgi:hypothetical protein
MNPQTLKAPQTALFSTSAQASGSTEPSRGCVHACVRVGGWMGGWVSGVGGGLEKAWSTFGSVGVLGFWIGGDRKGF